MPSSPDAAMAPRSWSTLGQLLRKEWTVFTPLGRFMVLTIYFLASLQLVFTDEAFFILGVALAAVLMAYVPTLEWFQETDTMMYSFPLDRNEVVLGRYLVAVLSGGAAGILWTLTGRLLSPILVAGRADPALFMTFQGGLTFTLAVIMMMVLLLPLYFGLGVVRGGIAFLGLSLLLLSVAYAMAGVAWGPGVGGSAGAIPPSHLIGARVEALISGLGPAGALSVVLVGSALAFWLSLTLSRRFFREREF